MNDVRSPIIATDYQQHHQHFTIEYTSIYIWLCGDFVTPTNSLSHHRCHVICRNHALATNTLCCGKFNKEVNQKIQTPTLRPTDSHTITSTTQARRTSGRTVGRTVDQPQQWSGKRRFSHQMSCCGRLSDLLSNKIT